jgi:hypothetical protein
LASQILFLHALFVIIGPQGIFLFHVGMFSFLSDAFSHVSPLLQILFSLSGVALSLIPTTVPVLLSMALGTALCSNSANTVNELAGSGGVR